jgi:hypothetical protein
MTLHGNGKWNAQSRAAGRQGRGQHRIGTVERVMRPPYVTRAYDMCVSWDGG